MIWSNINLKTKQSKDWNLYDAFIQFNHLWRQSFYSCFFHQIEKIKWLKLVHHFLFYSNESVNNLFVLNKWPRHEQTTTTKKKLKQKWNVNKDVFDERNGIMLSWQEIDMYFRIDYWKYWKEKNRYCCCCCFI